MSGTAWKRGDRLVHRFNPDLGAGRVVAVEERTLVVEFPDTGEVLRLSADADVLEPLVLDAGARVRVKTGDPGRVAQRHADGTCTLEDGRRLPESSLWPVEVGESLVERLAWGKVDAIDEFAERLDALHLKARREADGLGSFLGGRIRLFPHQLRAAEAATRNEPVRWLLADEVGLGKTVEACLVLNHLLVSGRAERVLVVAPQTLTVQWLGELWRKYHQVFVLLDAARLDDVAREHGAGFNPFDAHRRVIVALETLVGLPQLSRQAVAAGIDLLVVDEAHHLRRPRGHPGNAAWRAVAPIAELGRHVLLLTATPLEEDAHGFLRLVQLLRPDAFESDELEAAQQVAAGRRLPPCTTATRRLDIGGLPPRQHHPVELNAAAGWAALEALVESIRAQRADTPPARHRQAERIARALSSPAALEPLVARDGAATRRLLEAAAAQDPRMEWLATQAPRWHAGGDKTLLFVAWRETLAAVKATLEPAARLRAGVFHEDLSPGQRDIEVAQFRLADGPSILISTECGGEGRNFEFCTRLVLFDLPWSPITVEQRIGRLDRIGRTRPVEIVTFRPPSGLAAAVARLHEDLGLFREPLGGLDRELARVEGAVTEAALSPGPLQPHRFAPLVAEVRGARRRVRDAAYHELHRDPYRNEMAAAILARVPPDLDALNEEVVLAAARRLGFEVERKRGDRAWYVELGGRALVDHLPGVPPGARFLGTFSRPEAVEREELDFFATGHPLVEGILAEMDESRRGRTALLEVEASAAEGAADPGFGLLVLYADGPGFTAVAVDTEGRERPAWAARLTRRPLRTRRVDPATWTGRPGWRQVIRRLAAPLEDRGRPVALAAVRLVRREAGGS